MNLFSLCCCLLGIIFIIGDSTNFIMFKEKFKRPWALRVSLAYGLGTGTLGLLLFYLCLAGLKLTLSTILLISLPFAGIFMYQCTRWLRKRRQNSPSVKPFKKNGLIEYLLFSAIALSLTIITCRALLLPMHLPDDRAQWGLKAKMIYYEKTIALEALFDPERFA
jgi:multidrug transporter EmrE-like cation transporter